MVPSNEDAAAGGDAARGLEDTLEELKAAAEEGGDDATTVNDVLEAFGSRAYGPLLLIPALLALIPIIGGIPGASIFLATLLLLVSVQMLFRSSGIWMPRWVRDISVSSKKLRGSVKKARGTAGFIDRYLGRRWTFLTGDLARRAAAVCCILLAVSMYPLALVPFGVAPPAGAILLLALAITASDGILMAIGFAGVAVCAALAWYMFG